MILRIVSVILLLSLTGLLLSLTGTLSAQQAERYDYLEPTDRLITAGVQALMICNGLFVSNRTLDQVYEQELKLDRMPVLPPRQVQIDEERKAVVVGGKGSNALPAMRAAYRTGLGCIVMAPDQTLDDINTLPTLETPPPAGDPTTIPWPDGDLVEEKPLPASIDRRAIEAAADWAFERPPSQITLSLLVVHRGDVILERYAPGVDMTTRTRTWSTAKSIASTLIGMMVGRGELELDDPLPYSNWGSSLNDPETAGNDPRRKITLRNVLHMSSGLYPVDNSGAKVPSHVSYFGGASSVRGALDRGLVREPGTVWDYENYDTLLAVYALKTAIGDPQKYLEFPRNELFDKIGMRNTVPGVDRFGDFILSSQVYTNARDLARLGLLYLNEGVWNGERILPESWIRFVRTPARSTANSGRFYGGQWWLVPDDRTDVPQDAYATSGNRGQYTIVIPSYDLVIVRRGLDWGRPGFPRWDLVAELLKAFPAGAGGAKLTDQSNNRQ